MVPHPTLSETSSRARTGHREIAATDRLSDELPDLDLDPGVAAGTLVLNLPDGQYVAWFRREVLRSVDWGGDPTTKPSRSPKVTRYG